MSKKKITGYINITIPAKKATPTPPIGPALGAKKVNIPEFCKQFNEATKNFDEGTPIPVVISVYSDFSFTFVTKTPPVSFFIKKAAGLESGSSEAGKNIVGKLTSDQCQEIAKKKVGDMNTKSVESAYRMVVGSARSMGIQITD